MMRFITSDTHFNHEKIIEYCNRPFQNVKEMNDYIINNWNKKVSDCDTVIILGDFGFGTVENLIDILSKLNGKKFLIKGNHDRLSIKKLKEAGFVDVQKRLVIILNNKTVSLTHKPDENIKQVDFNLHGHLHTKNPYLRDGKFFDVGVDGNDFMLYSFEEITKQLEV